MTIPGDPRHAAAFAGHHDGVRFTCSPHRYGKNMVLTLENDTRDIFKNRAAWLAEALGGKWARGHQQGYRIAPTRALQWQRLYLAGWHGNVPLYAAQGVSFSPPDQLLLKLTLKEALAKIP